MSSYNEVVKAVAKNCDIDFQSANEISEVNRAIKNTLMEVYRDSEFPRKSVVIPTEDSSGLLINFAETIPEEFVYTAEHPIEIMQGYWYVRRNSSDTKVNVKGNALSSVRITGRVMASVGAIPEYDLPATFDITIKVTTPADKFDLVIPIESLELGSSFTRDVIISGRHLSGEYIAEIVFPDVEPQTFNIQISELFFGRNTPFVKLPEDFLIPLDVLFKSGDGAIMPSDEVHSSFFPRWASKTHQTILSTPNNFAAISSSNSDRYNRIGYTISINGSENRLYYKPYVNGQIELFYCYIPISDKNSGYSINNKIPIHLGFMEMIEIGATVRILTNKINSDKIASNEILAGQYNKKLYIYTGKYKELLYRYMQVNNSQETEVHTIMPDSLLVDRSMDLIG